MSESRQGSEAQIGLFCYKNRSLLTLRMPQVWMQAGNGGKSSKAVVCAWCVCVCVCVCVCMCVCVCVIDASVYGCIGGCTFVCACMHACLCMYACVFRGERVG